MTIDWELITIILGCILMAGIAGMVIWAAMKGRFEPPKLGSLKANVLFFFSDRDNKDD